MMLKEGADLATVSAYLGHTSLQMTEVYVTPSRDDKQRGGEILASAFRWDLNRYCRKNCRKTLKNGYSKYSENNSMPYFIAPVAQLEERLRPKEKVTGSIPVGGSLR